MTFPLSVRRWAGATAVVVASSLALAGCSDSSDDPTPASGGTNEPPRSGEPAPTDEPTSDAPSASESPSSSARAGTTVPIYFAGDGPGGRPMLFREFQRVTGDPLTEAARIVAGGGGADDPDYRTLWPQVEIASVTATDGVLLVEVPSDGFTERPDGMTGRQARLAVQQLVYSLQGVQQERVPVRIERPDTDARLFGLSTARNFTAASPLRTLNHVSITSPAEGDTVTGTTVRVTGVANSFEASGPCRLLQGDRELALVPYQLEGWTEDRLFPFEVEIPLKGATGELVVRCETDDPSGGAEGNGPSIDTKSITVR
ncbi:Gmad2 immunoglobulin-like domain-containing protein [Nocardioides hwasunensis]|uniref:GerMN domain-containing protein n=1 Tax=Nocardioides hwasunensis TaxID=397258 RepID=A0ABR8MJB0_9ACTN|nr:Gmad2 immunoglobulin-like domain-containing protein [Nocardioides hwasunensis]MBD3916136.1 GerMN domain-containing protein [Nocardioides hwasunensis]